MKRHPLFIVLLVAVGFGGAASLRSQSPTAPSDSAAKLKAMKEANVALIAAQKKTIEDLKALQKDAEQIKIFAKRG